MLTMAVGQSDALDAEDAVAAIVAQCREALGEATPKAGLLFSAFDGDHETILRGVLDAFPGVALIGSTSVAEMSSVLGYQEDSVMLALFASDDVEITAGIVRGLDGEVETATRRAVAEAMSRTDLPPKLCLTTPAATGDAPEYMPRFLASLREALGPDVPIIGGGATTGTVGDFMSTSVQFFGGETTDLAAPFLLFSGPLVYSFGIQAGWTPVGPRGRATKVGPGVVYEIDGRPALSFYERYLGPGIDPAFANPLAVYDDRSERFYLRAPRVHDRELGAVGVGGDVPENAEVQLTVAATDQIFEGTTGALAEAVERYPAGLRPTAAVVFSCAIRKNLLGTRTSREFEITREILGDAIPICGFYSFGEIAPFDAAGSTRLHNETIVALLLGTS